MNRLIKTDDFLHWREQEAKKNPLYDPNSKKWVVNLLDKAELSIVRANNQLGFVSWGWADPTKKYVICDSFSLLPSNLKEGLLTACTQFAETMNNAEQI